MRLLSFVLPMLALSFSAIPAMAAEKKVVYFPTWSADLDGDAQGVIDDAATMAKDHARGTVLVSGFASTTGGHRANQLLAELRAQVVADHLMEKGVKASRLRLVSRGDTHFVSTSLESRRVEVTVSDR